jgi:hypothetical protein
MKRPPLRQIRAPKQFSFQGTATVRVILISAIAVTDRI